MADQGDPSDQGQKVGSPFRNGDLFEIKQYVVKKAERQNNYKPVPIEMLEIEGENI